MAITINHNAKKLVIGAVCISALLIGCSKSAPWSVASIQTGTTEFSSCKLSYQNTDTLNGMDIEFLSLEDSCHLYLSVHSHQIRPYEKDPKQALISFSDGKQTRSFIGARHQGGQRVKLPDDAKDYLIASMLENKTLTISTSGYSIKVRPDSFAKKYRVLQQPGRFNFHINNPLHTKTSS